MILERLPCGVYAANCYIVGSQNTKDGIVIDPAGDVDEIMSIINKYELNIKYIILTHGHGDHIGGLIELKKQINAPILIHELDKEMLMNKDINLSSQMPISPIEVKPDRLIKDGEKLKIGDLEGELIHTPGHTPGSISIKIDNKIFTGDTLFKGSIGRTDLPGGSFDDIIISIQNKLLKYDDDITVLSGHGPSSTIGIEKATNPFIKNY
ncbi:MBL fold metallo-hydrolase [Clostridium sp. D2Q-11]|uniref:MBL fold metallo-hydrolase n=1 Tax=Anaeromonas frigoriresistens TaxID=2683708 RepID=A0A942Z9U8_9FIRM|nr:MBL fold metallo-hydrolase [Anaeromonas frigoriresistens]MBS4539693.1 MBL fold metallo-hydrolase [Anaeromonas frigoriresistens]